MKKLIYSFLLFLLSANTIAQVGIGTDNPDNSAMLQVESTDKGFLLPQMTSTQRIDVSSPASGLQVYDTTTNSIWFFNGSYWVNTQAMATIGDVKSGLQTIDHSGWVRLDGRSFSDLTPSQQAAASDLGLSGNLPNAADAYLVQNGGSMGAISGANTTTLTQANLPNVNFAGTAGSAGSHSHSGTTSTAGAHNHSPQGDGTFLKTGFEGSSASVAGGTSFTRAATTTTNGDHSHSFNTSSSGSHSHAVTVSSGGSGTPINIAPMSLTVNMFIYLGQ